MLRMHTIGEFNPPGPGVWELDSTHLNRPLSRAAASFFPEAATAGFKETTRRYGLMLDHLEFGIANRFVYNCARGVGAPKDAKAPPPKFIFKLLTKLHPELRRRARRIAEVFETKFWREDVARWDAEVKPAITRENTALQRVDLGALADPELADHLDRCFEAARRGVTQHHTHNATAMLALGDFLVHVRDWTGLPPAEVLPLLRGSSRVSRGATTELDELAAAIASNSEAQATLASGEPRAIIEALTGRVDDVGRLARRYVDAAGVRVATGYDVADLTLEEMPELLVENIRASLAGLTNMTEDDVARREAALREKVPQQHRAMFDELLAEARFTYRMRDERGYDNDAWSVGLTRRALLEAGRRLAARGRLHAVDHAVDLTQAEVTSLLRGGDGPTADEVAAHVHFRTTHTTNDAPRYLGGTPSGPPPPDWFPPAAARSERAFAIVMGEMFAARDNQKNAAKVSGFAASPGAITGTARLVLKPADMSRIRKGDVLITRSTAPAYNVLLPLLSGIVTDRGGTLSHAAVVAREYGIPAVVGCGNATELIQDGVRVRVDGTSGTVEVLA